MTDPISRDDVGEALRFLSETDDEYGEAKAEVERATWLCKHVRALVYPQTDGTVDERKSSVERSQQVMEAEDRRIAAIVAFEKLKAKRELKFVILEVWRSMEATRRRETIQ